MNWLCNADSDEVEVYIMSMHRVSGRSFDTAIHFIGQKLSRVNVEQYGKCSSDYRLPDSKLVFWKYFLPESVWNLVSERLSTRSIT